jgi:regulator of cell morphogenesis and NO signaling
MNVDQIILGDLVVENPDAAAVLHRYQLDFCCGGRRTVAQACAEAAIDPVVLLQEIEAQQRVVAEEPVRWDERPLDELIDHIITRFHEPLSQELPRLVELARKVEEVHADKPACPFGLANLLEQVWQAVQSHLAKEEQILFPIIRDGRGGWAHGPVQAMLLEHEDHGQNLRRIRVLTSDLTPPAEACETWREMYRSLESFEAELMEHIHLENNVLFLRALGQ